MREPLWMELDPAAEVAVVTPGRQPLDDGIVLAQPRELAVDLVASLLEGVDLGEQFKQARVQQDGYRSIQTSQRVANRLERALSAERNADAELTQAASQEVDALGASGHPL